tara:strand:+ start:729 stop:938 length:210 start_codon:yes stop_codon:yes gene_type:complete
MEYTTQCRLCKNLITITVDDEKDSAAKEAGLNLDSWISNSRVLCQPCYTYKETGHRPTNTPPMKDFLFE